MNRSLTLLMLFCILLLAACKVSQPGDVESSIMKSVKRTVTIGDKEKKNPIASSPDAIKEGGEHFQHHCQICHGLDGHATGVPFAAQMSPHSTPTHAKSARAGDPGSGARALFCSAPTASRGLTYFRAYGAGAEQKTRYSKI